MTVMGQATSFGVFRIADFWKVWSIILLIGIGIIMKSLRWN